MNFLDWIILGLTLAIIVGYGTWKSRKSAGLEGYLKGSNQMNWLTIGLSVMATQASAITFISTPGLAFDKGMLFVQNYFGLPFALIIISAFILPIYYRLKVFTAYEYLENRFNLQVRLLTAFLFLLQRGLAAGLTIYAPAIILSTALNWDLNATIIAVGLLVIVYTASGGTRAVSMTQTWQMAIILTGMLGVFGYLVYEISQVTSLDNGLKLAGSFDKMKVVSFSLDPSERYTIWTGLIGGFFLALSYFGTDQSQVQRYLGGKSISQSRMGLMFNAILKIPMQFLILLTGVLVFLFFEFNDSPLLFNQQAMSELRNSKHSEEVIKMESDYRLLEDKKHAAYERYFEKNESETNELQQIQTYHDQMRETQKEAASLHAQVNAGAEARESDYVFLYFILNYLPHGVIGLLLCVIISAAMSSTAGEINALAATTTIDFYQRLGKKERIDALMLRSSKLFTIFWGCLAIAFALFARLVENLIEAVNILGSLFYGTILGIFLVGFFLKKIGSRSVLIAAFLTETMVIALYIFKRDDIAYLLFNVIAPVSVVLISSILEIMTNNRNKTEPAS